MKSPSTSTMTDYGRILRRSWITVLIAVVGGMAVGWFAQSMEKPEYTSQAVMVAKAPGPPSVVAAYASDLSGRAEIETMRNLALSQQVLSRVLVADRAKVLGEGATTADLASRITVFPVPNSAVFRIVTTGDTAQAATTLASSMADQMRQVVSELEPEGSESVQSELFVVDAATPAGAATETSLTQAIGLGGAIGFAVAAIALIGANMIGNRVGDGRDALHTLRDVRGLRKT
ncbi:hypothetical protein OG579_04895 [Williamsia herbipolensis]|uniref:Polysaccharide chain length determinant N-terminal domain-containing protein n=1 Tax=Williamsia herbipolensis TaxID=1603258 RepID=A0AAU4K4Z5_9NOCA|nr:hypothetical protein [Williamsia herbipolensis]